MIYPPVAPVITPRPAANFANTGSPAAPITMYSSTDIHDFLPITAATQATANTESEIGTAPIGMERGERMHITAAKAAVRARAMIFLFLFILMLHIMSNSLFIQLLTMFRFSSV